MKMTNDVTKRCDDMLLNFGRKHGVDMAVAHDMAGGNTRVDVRDCFSFRPVETYHIIWDEASSLSEACTAIFVDLTRRLNLDEYNTDAFKIKNVVFNPPATIVLWEDSTKTVVKCQEGDRYSKETGLALCIAKKALGNCGNFNEVFKKWIPEESEARDSYTKTEMAMAELDNFENAARLFSKEAAAAANRLANDIVDALKKRRDRSVRV